MKTLLLAAALAAAAPAGAASYRVEEAEVSGEVLAVDRAQSLVTIEDGAGRRVMIRLPRGARDLDALEPGAELTVSYVPSVALAAAAPGEAAPLRDGEETRLSLRGRAPRELALRVKRASVLVVEVDRPGSEVTVRSPAGHHVVMRLADGFSGWEALRPGGMAELDYTDAVALQRDDEEPHETSRRTQ